VAFSKKPGGFGSFFLQQPWLLQFCFLQSLTKICEFTEVKVFYCEFEKNTRQKYFHYFETATYLQNSFLAISPLVLSLDKLCTPTSADRRGSATRSFDINNNRHNRRASGQARLAL